MTATVNACATVIKRGHLEKQVSHHAGDDRGKTRCSEQWHARDVDRQFHSGQRVKSHIRICDRRTRGSCPEIAPHPVARGCSFPRVWPQFFLPERSSQPRLVPYSRKKEGVKSAVRPFLWDKNAIKPLRQNNFPTTTVAQRHAESGLSLCGCGNCDAKRERRVQVKTKRFPGVWPLFFQGCGPCFPTRVWPLFSHCGFTPD